MRPLPPPRSGSSRRVVFDAPSEAFPLSTEEVRAVKAALSALILTLLLVTFEPYQAAFVGPAGSGNLVNQLGYGGLGLVAVLIHVSITPRAVAARLMRPAWVLMGLVLL